MKPPGSGSKPLRAFSLPVAASVASVRPCQACSITIVCASGSPCLWPYRRTSLIAPSFASEPELPKNTSLHAGQRAQAVGELLLLAHLVDVRGVDQSADLLRERRDQARMCMPEAVDRDAGECIEIFSALLVGEPRAAAVREGDRQAAIGVHQVRHRSHSCAAEKKNAAPGICSRVCNIIGKGVVMQTRTSDLLGEFDVIIVGAGTAGCLLANRLSVDPRCRVAVLEAGGSDDYLWIRVPVGYLYCIGNPRTDWCFSTEEEPGLNGRAIRYPRGRVLGGCSSINGMIYMRGQREDYDGWRDGEGYGSNPGWGWDDVLPHFMRHEDYHRGADPFHGAGNEWRVEKPRVEWMVLNAFQAGGRGTGNSCHR